MKYIKVFKIRKVKEAESNFQHFFRNFRDFDLKLIFITLPTSNLNLKYVLFERCQCKCDEL